jgi:hypothetical protein
MESESYESEESYQKFLLTQDDVPIDSLESLFNHYPSFWENWQIFIVIFLKLKPSKT